LPYCALSSHALFDFVQKDDYDGVTTSLSNGDNPNQLNSSGNSPLHVIVTKSFRNQNTFPIIIALLKAKADINLTNKEGVTPIQIALQSGWQDTAAFLFQLGAKFDANIRKKTKITW
jgi:ankyrin repeat protein